MKLQDTPDTRKLLEALFPGLVIIASPRPSGQRLVYFAKFIPPATKKFIDWGEVVLKVCQQLHPGQIASLQKEISILNSLKSEFYPKLFYTGVFAEDPIKEEMLPSRIFVSIEERLSAKPLSEHFSDFNTEQKVSLLLSELVSALSLLWERPEKLIHRDLKPENILVKSGGGIAVIDLGIVREEGVVGFTNSYAPFGPCSPPYASPEQARNDKRNITFKSDFFALGTIAYELITGTNPYHSRPNEDTLEVVLERVQKYVPPTLHSLGKTSKKFSDIVETLMKKQPYERFRTVGMLREALLIHERESK